MGNLFHTRRKRMQGEIKVSKFEKNEAMAEAVDRGVKFLEGLGRGDVATHEDISKATGIPYPSSEYYSAIVKLKARMEREHGVVIWSVTGVGYRLETVIRTLTVATEKRGDRSANQMRKAIGHVMSLDSKELKSDQKNARGVAVLAAKNAIKGIKQSVQEFKAVAAPAQSPSHQAAIKAAAARDEAERKAAAKRKPDFHERLMAKLGIQPAPNANP
jgi:hypothetical protein